MAREIRTVTVKGRYAEAVTEGFALDTQIKKMTVALKECKELLQDKTVKIGDGEQSVRLRACDSNASALLTIRRNVKIDPTDELKAGIERGDYDGVLGVERSLKIPRRDIRRAIEVLKGAGIEAEDVWCVSGKVADIEDYRQKNGADRVLDGACTFDETYAVKF